MISNSRPANYYPSLDGLRFVCCSVVVLGHSILGNPRWNNPALSISRMGVDIFFSLSGFLITSLLLREKVEYGSVSLFNFYMRRTLRIWPVYYTALFINLALLGFLGQRYLQMFGSDATSLPLGKLSLTYLLFLGNWIIYTVPTTMALMWSICVEEQFYILFPVMFVFSRRKYPVLLPAGIGLVVCIGSRTLLAARLPEHTVYVNTITHGDNLLIGASLAQLFNSFPSAIAKIVQAQVCWIVAAQICCAFNVASASGVSIDRDSEARSRSAIICEVERLEALCPRETTAGTSLSTAPAWLTITPETIKLGRIIRVKHVWRDRLVGTARAGWNGK